MIDLRDDQKTGKVHPQLSKLNVLRSRLSGENEQLCAEAMVEVLALVQATLKVTRGTFDSKEYLDPKCLMRDLLALDESVRPFVESCKVGES
jgi:hypothetical protein